MGDILREEMKCDKKKIYKARAFMTNVQYILKEGSSYIQQVGTDGAEKLDGFERN